MFDLVQRSVWIFICIILYALLICEISGDQLFYSELGLQKNPCDVQCNCYSWIRLLSLLSARRSPFVPKIMRVWDEKLYAYKVTDEWYWVCIYLYFSGDNRAVRAHKLQLLYYYYKNSVPKSVSDAGWTHAARILNFTYAFAHRECLRANRARKIFRAHDKLSSLVAGVR